MKQARITKPLLLTGCIVAVSLSFASHAQTIRYVNQGGAGNQGGSSWSNAAPNIQPMIDQSSSGDWIWVADGTYYPTVALDAGDARTKTFKLKQGVRIYGGFTGNTSETALSDRDTLINIAILSGDIDAGANDAYHVVYAASTDTGSGAITTATRLDGFRITGGVADGETIDWSGVGGGMFICCASPVVQNCMFVANTANHGGAVYIQGSGPEPPFDELPEAFPEFVSSGFNGNESDSGGGAIYNSLAEPFFTNCVFSGNTTTGHGAGIYSDSGIGGSYLSVFNCTFSHNTCSGTGFDGGGIWNGHDLDLFNTIFWDNTAYGDDHLHDPFGGTTNSSNNNVGASNPNFVDANGADNTWGTADDGLMPNGGSGAIDAGDQNYMPADLFDVDDDTNVTEKAPDFYRLLRVRGNNVDQGAIEHYIPIDP